MPSSLLTYVSNNAEVSQWTWGLLTIGTCCQKCVNTEKELALNKDLFQNKQIVPLSKRLKLSATDHTYYLSVLVKVCKGDPVAYNLNYFYVDKTLRNISNEI